MPHRNHIPGNIGKRHRFISDPVQVHPGNSSAVAVHLLQHRKLGCQKRGLHFIQPAVMALIDMVVLVIRTVIAQGPDFIRQVFVVRDHSPRIPQGPQILPGIEREACRVAKGTDFLSFVQCPVGLSAVFHHKQAVSCRKLQNGVHIAGLSVKVHGHNGLCLRSNGRLDLRRIDVIGPNIRLDEYRLRAYIGNRQGCGNIGIGRYNDLIPRADPQRFQSKHQRVQAVAHTYTVLCIAVLGEGLFKRHVFLSLNIPAGPKNTFKGRPQVRLQFPFHGKKAGKRNLHPIIPLLRRQYRRSFLHTPGIHHNPGYNPPHHTAPMPGPSAPRPGKNRTSPAT